MEVCDIVQEAGIKTILKKKKWKKENGCLPGASVRNPARDKVMRKEAEIRKACSDFRDPSGNS